MIPKRLTSPCRCGWCSAHSRGPFPRAFGGGIKVCRTERSQWRGRSPLSYGFINLKNASPGSGFKSTGLLPQHYRKSFQRLQRLLSAACGRTRNQPARGGSFCSSACEGRRRTVAVTENLCCRRFGRRSASVPPSGTFHSDRLDPAGCTSTRALACCPRHPRLGLRARLRTEPC
jgi:hypothetical protein